MDSKNLKEKQLAEVKRSLRLIYEVSKILSSSYETKESLYKILKLLSYYIDMHRGMILVKDKLSNELFVLVSYEIDKNLQDILRYKIGEGIVGKSFKYGQIIVIQDIKEEPTFMNKTKRKLMNENLSFYAIPIKVKNETIGVLAVDKKKEDVISYDEDIDILKMISSLIGEFIKKVERIEDEKKVLEEEKSYFAMDAKKNYSFDGLVGNSTKMKHVFEMIKLVSNTKSTVLIRGESGTGKEVVAKTIHYNSDRANKSFVAVNCAAIPKDLLEAELFGYEKGAFTGAIIEKKGKFEVANGGTIFLDEIGDMPLDMQAKLLRVLQERKVEKIGSTKSIDVDVRIIAATNRNLEEMVKKGNLE
ncbi:MAG: sigma 54-interacting transcriptional regulator [Hydrogenothermaceae bacterium]|nr:sigma 54-interacting transcriptional regulator [Hydrogenothermaceae bacterium]